jgi:hypothetical protein
MLLFGIFFSGATTDEWTNLMVPMSTIMEMRLKMKIGMIATLM